MKKILFLLLSVILLLNLNGCCESKTDCINITDNVTLGSCNFTTDDMKDYMLLFQLYNGKYYEDFHYGSEFGSNWTGDFQIAILDTIDNQIIKTYKVEEWDEDLLIRDKFEISIKDYNDDGNYEFLIGQYVSSNLNIYKMYYITKNLEIGYYDNIDDFYMSSKDYSPLLKYTENGNLKYSYYDNSLGKEIEKVIDINLLKVKDKQ